MSDVTRILDAAAHGDPKAADDETLLALDEALAKLSKEDPDSAEFIKLRFFAGLTNDEAA